MALHGKAQHRYETPAASVIGARLEVRRCDRAALTFSPHSWEAEQMENPPESYWRLTGTQITVFYQHGGDRMHRNRARYQMALVSSDRAVIASYKLTVT